MIVMLLDRGALAGYRLQDVAVEIYFGKDHPVDSSEQAFKTAARIAFKNAFMAASPVLLEPIVDLEITVPASGTGALLGYLNTKRGRIENQGGVRNCMDNVGKMSVRKYDDGWSPIEFVRRRDADDSIEK